MRLLLILIMIGLSGCSEPNYESRELPTKYPDTATSGAAYDATEELYKK